MKSDDLKSVIDRHRDALMKIAGVTGIGIGQSHSDPNQRCVLVYVSTDAPPAGLPKQIEGLNVEVISNSGFRAL